MPMSRKFRLICEKIVLGIVLYMPQEPSPIERESSLEGKSTTQWRVLYISFFLMICSFHKPQKIQFCYKITFTYFETKTLISGLIVLLFMYLIVFIFMPVSFKYSIPTQSNLAYPTFAIAPNINYSDITKFGIKGVKNFYVHVNSEEDQYVSVKIILGVWQILPLDLLDNENEDYNFDDALKNDKYNVLIYLHGNAQDRSTSVNKYLILRKFFHIFAVEFRGYADATKAKLTDSSVTDDMVGFYKFLKKQTNSKIFVWGHSLGTALSTHMLARLKKQNIFARGLVLEAPFTSLTDVMARVLTSFCNWVPWIRSTILQPMIDNDFNFDSKTYIVDVDCPILILHALDDKTVHYSLGEELFDAAHSTRNSTKQGEITFHLFEALGYGHLYIYEAPELPAIITKFVAVCEKES